MRLNPNHPRNRLRQDGFGFDLYAPLWVEQGGDDHGGCGTDCAEYFAVGAADLFPVFCMGDEHAGADYVVEGGACLGERCADELEDGAGLVGGGEVVGAYRAGA